MFAHAFTHARIHAFTHTRAHVHMSARMSVCTSGLGRTQVDTLHSGMPLVDGDVTLINWLLGTLPPFLQDLGAADQARPPIGI